MLFVSSFMLFVSSFIKKYLFIFLQSELARVKFFVSGDYIFQSIFKVFDLSVD